MLKMGGLVAVAAGLLVLGAACSSSGSGGRKVEITQKDEGCTPTSASVSPGEKLNLVIKNDSSNDAYELEGIDGTKFEESVVHEGKTRSIGYTVPDGAGVHKFKCYIAGGQTTVIELVAGGGAQVNPTAATNVQNTRVPSTPSSSTPGTSGDGTSTSVAVALVEYTVSVDKASVKPGKIRFIATNVSKAQQHELAVLKTKPDGSFDNLGEVEAIPPESGGSIDLDLAAGSYRLACLIAAGEAGSTVDHYKQGMHIDFKVAD
jgi:plastocyanin